MFQSVGHLVRGRKVPKRAKLLISKTFYVPVVTYAPDIWKMNKRAWSILRTGEMKYLKSIEDKTRVNKVCNTDVRKELNITRLRNVVENNTLRWLGNVKKDERWQSTKKGGKWETIQGKTKETMNR